MGLLLAISGKAGAGKTTFGKFLIEDLKKEMGIEFKLMNYADELKTKLMEEFGLSYDQVYGNLKEVPDHRYSKKRSPLSLPFENYEDGKLYEEKDLFWTPREIMQFIGTDCYRTINNNHWVESLFRRIDREKIENVVIADCRFENEIEAVLNRGGYHIRVTRPGFIGTTSKEHISETALNYTGSATKTVMDADFKITNEGTLVDLNKTSKSTVKFIKYLQENSLFKGEKDVYNS